MERISSVKLEQIDNNADYERLKDMSNTELVSFLLDAELSIGEAQNLADMAYDILIERGYCENE